MDQKKKMLLCLPVVVVAIFLIASVAHYVFVLAPRQAAEAAAEQQAAEEVVSMSTGAEFAQRGNTIANGLQVSDAMSAVLGSMYQYRWESPEAGISLLFYEGGVQIFQDGQDMKDVSFELRDCLDLNVVTTDVVGLVAIDGRETLMRSMLIETASVNPEFEIDVVPVNPVVSEQSLALTFTSYANKVFYPVAERPFDVIIDDAGKNVFGSAWTEAEQSLRAYVRSVYPSATSATFTDTVTTDLAQGISALFFVLDDAGDTPITVVHNASTGANDVFKGNARGFDMAKQGGGR